MLNTLDKLLESVSSKDLSVNEMKEQIKGLFNNVSKRVNEKVTHISIEIYKDGDVALQLLNDEGKEVDEGGFLPKTFYKYSTREDIEKISGIIKDALKGSKIDESSLKVTTKVHGESEEHILFECGHPLSGILDCNGSGQDCIQCREIRNRQTTPMYESATLTTLLEGILGDGISDFDNFIYKRNKFTSDASGELVEAYHLMLEGKPEEFYTKSLALLKKAKTAQDFAIYGLFIGACSSVFHRNGNVMVVSTLTGMIGGGILGAIEGGFFGVLFGMYGGTIIGVSVGVAITNLSRTIRSIKKAGKWYDSTFEPALIKAVKKAGLFKQWQRLVFETVNEGRWDDLNEASVVRFDPETNTLSESSFESIFADKIEEIKILLEAKKDDEEEEEFDSEDDPLEDEDTGDEPQEEEPVDENDPGDTTDTVDADEETDGVDTGDDNGDDTDTESEENVEDQPEKIDINKTELSKLNPLDLDLAKKDILSHFIRLKRNIKNNIEIYSSLRASLTEEKDIDLFDAVIADFDDVIENINTYTEHKIGINSYARSLEVYILHVHETKQLVKKIKNLAEDLKNRGKKK